VILTGPVGGGKSSVALALAEELRRRLAGKVAVIDLDLVYCMVRQQAGFSELGLWPVARRASGALASSLFAQGFAIVLVEGEFFTAEQFSELSSGSGDAAPSVALTLSVSYVEALRRVGLDAARGISRDPDFLREVHAKFLAALPFLREKTAVFAAEVREPAELALEIANWLAQPAGIASEELASDELASEALA
jgi:hypothetical protein